MLVPGRRGGVPVIQDVRQSLITVAQERRNGLGERRVHAGARTSRKRRRRASKTRMGVLGTIRHKKARVPGRPVPWGARATA